MLFNRHTELAGRHAFLSPSKYHWINYDDDRLRTTRRNFNAAQRGTELHAYAHEAIRLKILQRGNTSLSRYVNDAIRFRMNCEQILYVHDEAFGSADTISFRNNKLRIHDLKTGIIPGKIQQLEIYAAYFCLEYDIDPADIEIEMRIYQNDEVLVYVADPEVIRAIMKKTLHSIEILDEMRKEEM